MNNPYTLQIIKSSKNGAASAYLLENGSQIAKVTRAKNEDRFCSEIEFKWFSDRARDRFDWHCDALTMGEVVECLGFPFPFQKKN